MFCKCFAKCFLQNVAAKRGQIRKFWQFCLTRSVLKLKCLAADVIDGTRQHHRSPFRSRMVPRQSMGARNTQWFHQKIYKCNLILFLLVCLIWGSGMRCSFCMFIRLVHEFKGRTFRKQTGKPITWRNWWDTTTPQIAISFMNSTKTAGKLSMGARNTQRFHLSCKYF